MLDELSAKFSFSYKRYRFLTLSLPETEKVKCESSGLEGDEMDEHVRRVAQGMLQLMNPLVLSSETEGLFWGILAGAHTQKQKAVSELAKGVLAKTSIKVECICFFFWSRVLFRKNLGKRCVFCLGFFPLYFYDCGGNYSFVF